MKAASDGRCCFRWAERQMKMSDDHPLYNVHVELMGNADRISP